MTAVPDTLRQAIAEAIHVAKCGTVRCQHRPNTYDRAAADAVLSVFLAAPTVRRRFAIADAVDNEEDIHPEFGHGKSFIPGCADCGHDSLIRRLRAAGKTT